MAACVHCTVLYLFSIILMDDVVTFCQIHTYLSYLRVVRVSYLRSACTLCHE